METNEFDINKIIERINQLYKKSKEEGLTDDEKTEQADLRKVYIESFKSNLKGQLDGIKPNNPVNKGKYKN